MCSETWFVLMKLHRVLQELEQNLFLPHEIISCEEEHGRFRCTAKYEIVSDASMLNCGCIISQALHEALIWRCENQACCPVCQYSPSSLIGPVKPLRTLYDQLQFFKREETTSPGTHSSLRQEQSMLQQNLISMFHSLASEMSNSGEQEPSEVYSLDNVSNTKTMPIQDSSSTSVPIATTEPPGLVHLTQLDEEKEFFFAKCFPMYRKRSQFNTHNKFLRTKSKQFINTAISPDCTKFALITENKWEVYHIPPQRKKDRQRREKDGSRMFGIGTHNKKDNSDSSGSIKLLFCGKASGEYGPS